jgi:hypothetical protein
MVLLVAAFLVVHGSIHIGYVCGPSWPFQEGDPWPITLLGLASGSARDDGAALVLVAFLAFLFAAVAAVGPLPARLWRPLVVVGSVASAILLVIFATPWTVPGLLIDVVLLWAVVVGRWRPARLVLRRKARGPEAGRPVTPEPEPTTMTWLAMGGR